METHQPPQPPDLSSPDRFGLNLEPALLLLQQAGVTLPDVTPGSVAWLQAVIDALCELSSKDALTGLANRRNFEMVLDREVHRVARSGESTLLLALDIDHFKSINDTHGHGAGDLVIQAVARAVLRNVRPMDTVARVGGEEFAVVLPSCPASFGSMVAERIRASVESELIQIAPGQHIGVTVSVGGAYAPQWVRSSPLIWTERADRQLYRAKSEGRNRVCMEPHVDTQVSAEEKSMLFAVSQQEGS